MRERILSYVELDTVNRNLNMVESRLGYPVPRHLVNINDLKNSILTEVEARNVADNIHMINIRRNGNVSNYDSTSFWVSTLPWSLPLVVCLATFILDWISGGMLL